MTLVRKTKRTFDAHQHAAKREQSIPRRSAPYAGGALVFFALWVTIIVASGAGWNPFKVEWDFGNSGAFGDSFGPLSALMASVAAISATAAYLIQHSETERLRASQQRDEQRREQERGRQLEREVELDKRSYESSFEETFFNLLASLREIVSHIDVKSSSGVRSGHDAFQSMLATLGYNTGVYDTVEKAWLVTAEHFSNDLNHYFRFLYHVIRYVDGSKISNKYFYVRLVRAMLSESELVLIALNCEYGEGKEKFKPLVERYALLHNISEQARRRWKLEIKFASSAFEHEAKRKRSPKKGAVTE